MTLTPDPAHVANILDPIHATLDPRVFDNPAAPEPTLRPELQQWIVHTIFEVLDRHGYDHPDQWLTLVLTGSLTTYQYSDASDVDVNLFVDTQRLPDWSRAEMSAIIMTEVDETPLPGTPHPMQCFVIPPGITPQDKFKPGLRSGLVVWGKDQGRWLVPPDRERVHDVEAEMNDAYTVGLLAADKLDLLMRYEPEHARAYWTELHNKRREEAEAGKGDFATSNIIWKMIANRFGEHPHFKMGAYKDDPKIPGRRRWVPEHDWRSDRALEEEAATDPAKAQELKQRRMTQLVRSCVRWIFYEMTHNPENRTDMLDNIMHPAMQDLSWVPTRQEIVQAMKTAMTLVMQRGTGDEGSPDLYQPTSDPRLPEGDELDNGAWAPDSERVRTDPSLQNNPYLLSLDQQVRGLSRLGDPESMGFQDLPEGLDQQIPGWGGWVTRPHGLGPRGTGYCRSCNHNFPIKSWDQVKPSERDWTTDPQTYTPIVVNDMRDHYRVMEIPEDVIGPHVQELSAGSSLKPEMWRQGLDQGARRFLQNDPPDLYTTGSPPNIDLNNSYGRGLQIAREIKRREQENPPQLPYTAPEKPRTQYSGVTTEVDCPQCGEPTPGPYKAQGDYWQYPHWSEDPRYPGMMRTN